jgi:tetratricopeptide (TPR) repeat protein
MEPISLSAIIEGLQAVGFALKVKHDQVDAIIRTVTDGQGKHVANLPCKAWLEVAKRMPFNDHNERQIANLAIALASLRESRRQDLFVSADDLDQIWSLVKDALQCGTLNWNILQCTDGSQGLPLWSLVKDGRVQELFRLHIWLPGAVRVDPDSAMHMHQLFAQSWTLAGEGTYSTFSATVDREDHATHVEYTFDNNEAAEDETAETYRVPSKASTITHTTNLYSLNPVQTELQTRNMSCCIPAGVYYATTVEPDALHARILLLDSTSGSTHDVPFLEPTSPEANASHPQPLTINAADIADLITELRSWEVLQEIGLTHSDRGEWEEALRSYRTALHICQNNKWLDSPRYKHVSLGTIGKMYRMLGRYQQACQCLEETINGTPQSRFRVDCAGELAMVYRHMDRLQDAKRAAEEQYYGAKQLNLEKFACRAIGNVGMVNYQLYLLEKDDALLRCAIDQLNERIERAQRFGDVVLEAIGHSRLSLCYIAQEQYAKAVETAQKNYDLTCLQPDATKIGFAKAFLGRALLFAGRKNEAVAMFNSSVGCSPVIALCKEISSEHRQYIVEMIDAGTDLKLRDQQGYTALECAVYNGDSATAKIIEQGLRVQISREGGNVDKQLNQFQYEATLRKGYRDIFQDRLRPVLLSAKDSTLQDLRQIYAASLAENIQQQDTFDSLKYVRYADFLQCGRLPRSDDGYTQKYSDRVDSHQEPFIIFCSYRWIAKGPRVEGSTFSPDDAELTQYHRMLRAIEQFLHRHPDVNRDQMCIWIVSLLLLPLRNNGYL